jgi:4-hydroxy-3-methylbut-2-enyl diphosphate reductase
VHREAVRFADDDYDILLIGHEGHEEVVGTAGEAPEHISSSTAPTTSTTSRSATPTRSSGCRRPRCRSTRPWRRCGGCGRSSPALQDPPSDDICYATQNRQLAVKQMAPTAT